MTRPPSRPGDVCRRLRNADRCPTTGPCPECGAPQGHRCELGQRLATSPSARTAVEDTIAGLQWAHEEGPLSRELAVRRILQASCRGHRAQAEALLGRDSSATRPASDSDHAAPIAPKESPKPTSNSSEVILVVEDDPSFRRDLCELIESCGFRAVGASNGADAIRHLRASGSRPRLILLDLNMPEVDGFSFRAWLRGEARLRTVPVVVISGQVDLVEEAKRLDVAMALTKPVSPDAVVELVRSYSA